MKQFKRLLIPLLSLTLFIGCMTANQQRTTFNTLGSIEQTATATVTGYYVACAKGFADTNGIPKVASSFNKFQGVMQVAVILAQNNTNALATENVMQELSAVTATVATFTTKTPLTIK